MRGKTKRVAGILLVALLFAGCGGGGNGGGGGGGGGGTVQDELAFDMGFQQCAGYSISDLAATYNTESTPEAVAEAVAKSTPTQPESRPAIKQGCLAGLKKK